MSYERMGIKEKELKHEIDELFLQSQYNVRGHVRDVSHAPLSLIHLNPVRAGIVKDMSELAVSLCSAHTSFYCPAAKKLRPYGHVAYFLL
jgi:hypothetical protein